MDERWLIEDVDKNELLAWAIGRWYIEVSVLPKSNPYFNVLDKTWKQVIERLGGDISELVHSGV